jgi:hypothetical protein
MVSENNNALLFKIKMKIGVFESSRAITANGHEKVKANNVKFNCKQNGFKKRCKKLLIFQTVEQATNH